MLLCLNGHSAIFNNPFTTNAIPNAFYDTTTKRFTIGTPAASGPTLLTLGGATGITNGIYIGDGIMGNGNNLQLWQTNADSYLSFGKAGTFSFNLYDNFNQLSLLKIRNGGISDLGGNWRPLNVGPTKVVLTDASTNLVGVAIPGNTNVFLNGNGAFTAVPGTGGSGITNSGVGTNNYLAKWTGTNSLGSSQINDDGTNITAGTSFSLNPNTPNGTMALGNLGLNPDAVLTLFGPIAWNDSAGPYLNGNVSGNVDIFTLGLNDGAGATEETQRIQAARGLTDGVNLELLAGTATDGQGGNVTIRASAGVGVDQDGADVTISASDATGGGTPGNVILVAGSGGIVEVQNSLILDTSTPSTLLKADSGQIVTSIANAVGILTNDGSGGLGFSTNISQAITINNFTVTNLTVQSNLVVNQSIKLQGKELGSTHVNGTNVFPVVNITNTASVTWAVSGSNITATATASGDTSGTNIVSLTQTGTNAPSLDFSLVARGGVFKISLTNNCYFGLLANANNTDFKHCWLAVQQPSTGTCLVTFTNKFGQPQGSALINDTNNGAVVWYEMVTSPFTNGIVDIWMSQRSATF